MTAITGNTYPVRRELRALSAEWDSNGKRWLIADDKAEAAKALVSETGRARANVARRERYTGTLTRIGGGRGYIGTDQHGRAHFGRVCGCEDYPCCGH